MRLAPLAGFLADMQNEPIDCSAINFALSHPEAYERMRQEGQAKIDALFEPHRNRQRAEQEARWAREEGNG